MNVSETTISMIGLGYIGLPTAILAAQSGYRVMGYDVDAEKIAKINAAQAPIIEPEIEERLQAAVSSGRLTAHEELQHADYYIIAVPTPFHEGKKADLSYVFNAGSHVARILKPGATIIIESTIPVGTTQRFAQLVEDISGLKNGQDFFVAHCPERVLPGKVFFELVDNDRVIGGYGLAAAHKAKDFYAAFVKGQLYTTTDASAEMVKLIENSSRDIQIALANQLDAMCKQAQINVHEVIELANKHPRVNILQPGCGVGGHCIAVDPWFLIETFDEDSSLLKTARMINDSKPFRVIQEVSERVRACQEGMKRSFKPNVLLLGLTFKPNIDDVRESPALAIAKELNSKSSFNVMVCEPNLTDEHITQLNVGQPTNINAGLESADIVVCLVKHDQFLSLIPQELADKNIVDTCGLMYSIDKNTALTLSRRQMKTTTL